ncbi:protoglobin domain-containing protein [Comamonas guangdongensis]|uniref:Protoglobin domain-containing protein n=1 Tax=Comamonas guangdongensis TaxID=510515 RepID=A0ABV3ZY82_9BURK
MNPARKHLLEQMYIHDLEISRRKSLLGFSERDAALLVACRPFMQTQRHDLAAAFLGHPSVASETALLIRDEGVRKRLRPAVMDYMSTLFSGVYDESYANSRLRIGLAHGRLGVSPTHYLCEMHRFKSLLMDALETHLGGHPDREATRQALDKLLYFDMALVLDTYIGGLLAEVESSRDKVFEHAYKLENMVAEQTGLLRLSIGSAQFDPEDRQFPERPINAAGRAMHQAKSLDGDPVASAAVSGPGRYRADCGECS